jgi:geranylgeranyl pyrophosphate synthase
MIASVRCKTPSVSSTTEGGRIAAEYHLNAGGQRVRTKIALQAGLAVGLSDADAVIIAATVELLHNASLVHDDIEDGDELRRGGQAVWVRFGVNTAICAGDLLLSAAYATLCGLEEPSALGQMIQLIHERVGIAIDGQCADLDADRLTVDDTSSAIMRYEKIAMSKSGALLSLSLELVLLASGHKDYLPLAGSAIASFAIGYQIVDDLRDVQSDLYTSNKQSTYNIVSIFRATASLPESIQRSKILGLEKIDLAILLAERLPFNIGERLADYARQLRSVLVESKFEA